MYEDIRPTWLALLKEGGARQRLLDSHPLHLYFGSDANSKALFFLVTPNKPFIPELSSDVSVERGQRKDGSWTVVLTLLDVELTPTFITLCIELARHSQVAQSESQALILFFDSLHQWRALLRIRRSRLSTEEIRGLVGELTFCLNYLTSVLTLEEALSSWQGPFGAPQDFALPSRELFEVKTIHTGGRSVEISSPDQLDPLGNNPLALVLITVDESESGDRSAVTPSHMVDQFRARLGQGSPNLEKLDQRLSAIGFDLADEFYREMYFAVSGARFYHVANDFPRLKREVVPASVDQVRYRLRIAGISDYLIEVSAGDIWIPTKDRVK